MTSRLACALLGVLLSPAIAAAEDEAPPLSIYGFARLDLLVNDSRMSNVDAPSFVELEPSDGQLESELTMTPRLSRIGLSIDRWEVKRRMFGEGKVEIDFAGGTGANAIRLRHAYASLSMARDKVEVLAGQTWDLMSPLFPSAQNDTQLRYAGNLGDRRAQLRLSVHPIDLVHIAVAAAAPAVLDPQDVDGDGQVDSMAAARPMLQWLFEVRSRLRRDLVARMGISGHVGTAELADRSTHAAGSVAAHFYMPFTRRVVLLGEAYVGTSLAELGGGVAHGLHPMSREPVRGIGGWLELALLPTARHMLALGTSVDVARSDELLPGERTRNGTIYSVLRYKPRPSVQLGVEHLYWKTDYKEMGSGVANRVDAHVSVFF